MLVSYRFLAYLLLLRTSSFQVEEVTRHILLYRHHRELLQVDRVNLVPGLEKFLCKRRLKEKWKLMSSLLQIYTLSF